eukprot:jgi/Picre1/32289/NNA_007635.t1
MSGILQTVLKRQGKRSLSLVHQQQSWWFGKKVSLQQDGMADSSRQYSAAAEPVAVSNDADYEKFSSDADRAHVTWPKVLNQSLEQVDPELYDIIEHEKNRQYKGLELIPI